MPDDAPVLELAAKEELAANKILADYDFTELCKQAANAGDEDESLNVLVDLLIEKGELDVENLFHAGLVQALEQSTARIRKLHLEQARSFAKRKLMNGEELPKLPPNPFGNLHPSNSTYGGFLEPLLDPEKKAADRGCLVVRPKENELQLDFDTLEQLSQFRGKTWPIFQKYFDPKAQYQVTSSQSGLIGHEHVTVTLSKPVSALERILFQAALGSDPVRELLSLVRLYYNLPDPTLFFERSLTKEPKKPRGPSVYTGFY